MEIFAIPIAFQVRKSNYNKSSVHLAMYTTYESIYNWIHRHVDISRFIDH